MRIEIAKRADGAGLLRCVRDDGSVTWQKQRDLHAKFFVVHDLTHFAVETVLGYRRGFFGLVAEGWDIDDTTGKGARGPIPDEALEVERMVGLLVAEYTSGTAWETDSRLSAVREMRAKLLDQFWALQEGETLVLQFETPVGSL